METDRHTEFRKEKCRARRALAETARAAQNAEIFQKVTALQAYREAKTILIYASYGAEADTFSIIRHALLQGKRVYCPRVEEDHLVFYRIHSTEDLKPGYRSILEPAPGGEAYSFLKTVRTQEPAETAALHKKELIIVPGTVFDEKGHRIGYGGGFYDRFLSGFRGDDRPCFAGLCFGCQMTEQILPRAHDVDMDLVIHS